MLPAHTPRNIVNVTTNKTLAATDCGTVQNITATGVTVTLPAAAAGLVGSTFTVRMGGNSGDFPFTLAPNAADGVNGLGFTAAVGKGALSSIATNKFGDEITVVCSGVTGVNAWYITNAVGTWTRLP